MGCLLTPSFRMSQIFTPGSRDEDGNLVNIAQTIDYIEKTYSVVPVLELKGVMAMPQNCSLKISP